MSKRLLVFVLSCALLVSGSVALAVVTNDPVFNTRAREWQAAATATHVAWTRNSVSNPGHSNVFVKAWGGTARRVNARGTHGVVGSIVGDDVVYQQVRPARGISDIWTFDIDTGRRRRIDAVSTRAWEYWPKASSRWLMFVRYRARTGTQVLILRNRSTGTTRVLAGLRGRRAYVQPGQVTNRYATWLAGYLGNPMKVHILKLSTDQHRVAPDGGRYNWAPSVTPDGTVYFGRTGARCGSSLSIFRWPWGGSPTRIIGPFARGIDTAFTSTYTTADGKIRILWERFRCARPRLGADIYQIEDDFVVLLTVAKDGNGEGTVTSSPAGIDCGTDCTQYFEPAAGKTVTLTATPAEGDSFTGWSDPACPGTGPCTVTIDAAKTIKATFSNAPGP